MKKKRHLGELEFTVLELIKKRKTATVSEIQKALKNEIAYTTVMTVMHRLFEKKILCREKQNRSYIYWLSEHKKSPVLERLSRLVFGGNKIEMIAHFIENTSGFSKKELDQMDEIIQKAKNRKYDE